MKKLAILPFFLAAGIAGCGPTIHRYYGVVVKHDVPAKPTITVIPSRDGGGDAAFANEVEAVILRSGAKVVERPSFQDGAGRADSRDFVELYKRADVSHVVVTYKDDRRLRLVENGSGQVVGQAELGEDLLLSVRAALAAAGLVRGINPSEAGFRTLLAVGSGSRDAVWALLSLEQRAEIAAYAKKRAPPKLTPETGRDRSDPLRNMEMNEPDYPVLKDTDVTEGEMKLMLWLHEQRPFLGTGGPGRPGAGDADGKSIGKK